jgi:hypothetical protein
MPARIDASVVRHKLAIADSSRRIRFGDLHDDSAGEKSFSPRKCAEHKRSTASEGRAKGAMVRAARRNCNAPIR